MPYHTRTCTGSNFLAPRVTDLQGDVTTHTGRPPLLFFLLFFLTSVYDQYASKIRLEYHHIEEKEFYQRRAQVCCQCI